MSKRIDTRWKIGTYHVGSRYALVADEVYATDLGEIKQTEDLCPGDVILASMGYGSTAKWWRLELVVDGISSPWWRGEASDGETQNLTAGGVLNTNTRLHRLKKQ